MTGEFTDLEDAIEAWFGDGMSRATRDGVRLALRYLDRTFEPTTVMQSEFDEAYKAFGDMDGPDCYKSVLASLGIVVSPEPTNAERLLGLMGEAPSSLNRRDLAAWLDKRGVKA